MVLLARNTSINLSLCRATDLVEPLQFLGNHMPIRKIYEGPWSLPGDLEQYPKSEEDKYLENSDQC
jgi:hypothetical protein